MQPGRTLSQVVSIHRTSLAGLLAGIALGLVATSEPVLASEPMKPIVELAQQVVSYLVDPQNAVCWTQSNMTQAEANAMKVRVTYNVGQPTSTQVAITHKCTGTASPWQCEADQTIPLSLQTIGDHPILVEAANADPVTGVLSPYATIVSGTINFRTATTSPPANSGSNLRIIKKVIGGLLAMLGWPFRMAGIGG